MMKSGLLCQNHILNLGHMGRQSHKVFTGSVSCPVQLSGWTSNLVDIVMAHHFSTVSVSPSILLTLDPTV